MGLLKLIGDFLLIGGVLLLLLCPVCGMILIVMGLLFTIAGKSGGKKYVQYVPEFKIYHCKKCQKETKHNKIGKVAFRFGYQYQCQECGTKMQGW